VEVWKSLSGTSLPRTCKLCLPDSWPLDKTSRFRGKVLSRAGKDELGDVSLGVYPAHLADINLRLGEPHVVISP
jgi:hypothetical protein